MPKLAFLGAPWEVDRLEHQGWVMKGVSAPLCPSPPPRLSTINGETEDCPPPRQPWVCLGTGRRQLCPWPFGGAAWVSSLTRWKGEGLEQGQMCPCMPCPASLARLGAASLVLLPW